MILHRATALPHELVPQRRYYGANSEQFGDLRVPPGDGPHPVIAYFHGGGWRSIITLDGSAAVCSALSQRGYATWSIEYRRIGNGGGWPATFEDVLSGAAYLHGLALEFPLDLSRTFVAGQSAGGQLALWLASRASYPTCGVPPPALLATAVLAPATDLRAIALGDNPAPELGPMALPALLGGTPADVPERYAAASPIELVPIGVPQLVVQGNADTTVPPEMSQAYVDRARSQGDTVKLSIVEGAGHRDLWDPASAAFTCVLDAVTTPSCPLMWHQFTESQFHAHVCDLRIAGDRLCPAEARGRSQYHGPTGCYSPYRTRPGDA